MSRRTWLIIGLAAAAVAGYFVYRYYKNRQNAGAQSPTGSFGTNLNSVAPELVGGSTGPSLGPAVSLPVNITLTSDVPNYADQDKKPRDIDRPKRSDVDTDRPDVDTTSDDDVEGMNDPDVTTPAGVTMQAQPANLPIHTPLRRP